MTASVNDYDDCEGFFHVKTFHPGSWTVLRTPLPIGDGQPPDEVIAVFPHEWRAEDYAAACNRGLLLVVPGGRWNYEVPEPPAQTETVQ